MPYIRSWYNVACQLDSIYLTGKQRKTREIRIKDLWDGDGFWFSHRREAKEKAWEPRWSLRAALWLCCGFQLAGPGWTGLRRCGSHVPSWCPQRRSALHSPARDNRTGTWAGSKTTLLQEETRDRRRLTGVTCPWKAHPCAPLYRLPFGFEGQAGAQSPHIPD